MKIESSECGWQTGKKRMGHLGLPSATVRFSQIEFGPRGSGKI